MNGYPHLGLIVLGSVLALLPALFWLGFFYAKDKAEPEPKRMILYAFFFGALAVLPLLGLVTALDRTTHLADLNLFLRSGSSAIVFLLVPFVAALLEEWLKHFAVLRLGKSLKIEFNQIIDGIIYSMAAALGFAFAENIFYFVSMLRYYNLDDAQFWSLIAFRSLITTLSHALFSGLFGYFWAQAFLSTGIAPRHRLSVSRLLSGFVRTCSLHVFLHHLLPGRPSLHGHEKAEIVREGLLIATICHALFNLFIDLELYGYSLKILIVPLFLAIFLFLALVFKKPQNVAVYAHPPKRAVAKKRTR